ncbi:hypothetical protein QYM36_010022 [Artemia franciscana]|uniref:Proteasomal ATPase-associated factor 1 n=2 Tax=Artemia franciscana TaxID=6661 RepID=A0AA88HUD6_ARTSF|nr:hypothetical protein QYM36_010022 [Artemia franciscana]
MLSNRKDVMIVKLFLYRIKMPKIGIIQIQHDWDEVLKEKGKIWISFKYPGEIAVQGHVDFSGPMALASSGFEVIDFNACLLKLKHIESSVMCVFLSPKQKLDSVFKKSTDNLDVTSGGLGVATSSGSDINIFDTATGKVLRTLQGHLGEVRVVKFFPSGIVVLSGGADFQLKVWCAKTGSCAATFKGHSAAISDVGIVERGRNIVSVSKDGTAKLWDCGKSECIATVYAETGVITSCALLNAPNDFDLKFPSGTAHEREVGTEKKLLVLAKEDGSLICVSLFTRQVLFTRKMPSVINTVVSDSHLIYAGCDDGTIIVLNPSHHEEPRFLSQLCSSSVYSILPFKSGFISSHRDGTVIYIDFRNPLLHTQLTGSYCDPVLKVVTDGECVFTCCRDGVIRKFSAKAI